MNIKMQMETQWTMHCILHCNLIQGLAKSLLPQNLNRCRFFTQEFFPYTCIQSQQTGSKCLHSTCTNGKQFVPSKKRTFSKRKHWEWYFCKQKEIEGLSLELSLKNNEVAIRNNSVEGPNFIPIGTDDIPLLNVTDFPVHIDFYFSIFISCRLFNFTYE